MGLNLIKVAVGIENIQHLSERQLTRINSAKARGDVSRLSVITRNMPIRHKEILNGGSLYWVIKGSVQVRQKIIGIEKYRRETGQLACLIILDLNHVRTEQLPFRAFQGWRYLPEDKIPQDLNAKGIEDTQLPHQMAADLKALGLL